MTKVVNRARRARENAGLSVGQTAKLLGIEHDALNNIEEQDKYFVTADQTRLADLYGVNVQWLSGLVEQYDYDTVKRISGADELSFHDRDIVAEFAASMSRRRAR